MDDADFQLCLDIDDYVSSFVLFLLSHCCNRSRSYILIIGPQAAQTREDKRQSASAASYVDDEGTEKRKIDDVDSGDEMDIDNESISPSASKRVKASVSGEEVYLQGPSTFGVHGLGDQTSTLGIEGDYEASREPFTFPSAPLTRTTTAAGSPVEAGDISVDTAGNLVRNETRFSGHEAVNRAPLSHLPYGHLIADIPVPVPTAVEREINEIRRRRRQGRGLIDFEIYEDAEARQDLLREIHMLQDDPTYYSSPREEDKENSDESFGPLDTDGEDADNEFEADDDDEDDEYENEDAGLESGEDSRQNPGFLASSSNSSRTTLAELTPFSDQMTRTLWRYSVFSARRGRR